MGGYAHGEVASSTVIGMIGELDDRLHSSAPADPLAALDGAVALALGRITEQAERDPGMALMGSTLTALLWQGDGFGLAHIGDSRGYLLRDGELRQVTRDHTLVQSLVDEGRITEVEAAEHPRRSMLTRVLQAGGAGEPDLTTLPAEAGDRLLLCSDGLTEVVPADVIRDVLATGTPWDAATTLISQATHLDSPDNITCVVVDVVTEEPTCDVVIVGAAAAQPRESLLTRLTRMLRRQ
jgi:protein phosphatase